MSCIIIRKDDDISDYDALLHAQTVIRGGKLCGECYCPETIFADGTVVSADKKRAHIFTVTKEKKIGREEEHEMCHKRRENNEQ